MKRMFKKIAGMILAAAMMVTAASCADTAVALTIDGEDIKAGEYIFTQFSALSSALSKFEEENPDLDTTVVGFDYYKYNVEGIPFRDWITNETVTMCARRAAYGKLFDELNLEFTAEEKDEYKTAANNVWSIEDPNIVYYGIDYKTWGEYYESVGISKASYQKVYEDDAKAEKVFHAYYGKDGTKEVSDDELWAEMKENYARFRMLEVKLVDADDNALSDTAAIAELKTLAENYKKQLEDGKLFSEVSNEYEMFLEERDREAHPENYIDDEETGNEEDADSDEDAEEENNEDAEEEETEPSENDDDRIVKRGGTSPSEEVVKKIFELGTGDVEFIETEETYYVVQRLDITERTDWFEEYSETILHGLKGDEMLDEVSALADSMEMIKNQAALNRYEPKTLM